MPVMMIDISETTNSWWDYKHWIVWCKSIFDTYHCNSAIFQPFWSPKRWGFVNRASIERMVVVSGRGTAEGDGNGLATEVDIIVVVGCFEMKKWKWNGRFGAKGHVSRIGDYFMGGEISPRSRSAGKLPRGEINRNRILWFIKQSSGFFAMFIGCRIFSHLWNSTVVPYFLSSK